MPPNRHSLIKKYKTITNIAELMIKGDLDRAEESVAAKLVKPIHLQAAEARLRLRQEQISQWGRKARGEV